MQNLVSPPPPFGYIFPSARAVLKWRTLLRPEKSTHCHLFVSPIRPTKALKKLHRSVIKVRCGLDFSEDAPFAIAIGACILSSLVLAKQHDEKPKPSTDASLGGDDVRSGAMTIISFIPLFNWLGWVFAWLDTNEQRYLFYASVYLAPYVRTGFSLSLDDNWLLILSYMACIAHVQLEANLQTGGVEFGKTFLNDNLKQLQMKGRSESPGDQSENFQESAPVDNEDIPPPPEEDFSQIELSEFDKKLYGMKVGNDEEQPHVKSLEDAEKGKYRSENSDQ